jgi:small-conductance mechanosensitive channel
VAARAAVGQAQQVAAPTGVTGPTASAPEAPKPFPVADIAAQAQATVARLRGFEEAAEPVGTVASIESELPELERRVSRGIEETERVLKARPSLASLDALIEPWADVREQARAWVAALTQRAQGLDDDLAKLDALRGRWLVTQAAAPAETVPGATIGRIESTLAVIGSVRGTVADRRSHLLVLQDRAAQQLARSDEMLGRIDVSRRALLGQLFVQDGLPFWEFLGVPAWERMKRQANQTMVSEVPVVTLFTRQHTTSLIIEGVLFVVLGVVFTYMRRRARRWTALDETLIPRFRALDFPWASAALVSLLIGALTPPLEPRPISAGVALVALLPIVRLVAALSPPVLAPVVWLIGIFHVVDLVRALLTAVPVLEQSLFLLQLVALLVAVALVRRHLAGVALSQSAEVHRDRLRRLGRFVQVLAAVALIAGALGYLRLARLLEFFAIGMPMWGMVLWGVVRLSDALVGFALRSRPLRLLRAVQEHRLPLERRVIAITRFCAVLFWAMSVAGVLAIRGPIQQRITQILEARMTHGALNVSLGDILIFALVVWLTFILSSAVRVLLAEDIFSRVHLPRGVPTALSSFVHYVILLIGFFLGLAALGLDFTRITILAGALGVGVGFGLQNIVNNFVSGLILLFERPIQIGDAVQLGTLTGEVKRIGIRSSTLRTWDGAEVIVPNGSLVSDQVTNWTLSDRMRRFDLEVGVAYGTDPQQVVALLAEVARGTPGVLPEPPPIVLFLGFGDSALNFQLRAWTAHFEEWMKTRSDLGLAVHDALEKAGITVPFPQREVRVVGEADGLREQSSRG